MPILRFGGFGDEFEVANVLADGAVELVAEDESAKPTGDALPVLSRAP